MVNEQEEIKLGYLLDPCFELSNTAGKPLTNGWIEVYIHGTRNKYYCYSDFGGTLHPFKIPLDSLGSNIVLADPERAYDVYVYNHFGSLVMSRYNVSPGHAGGAAISSGGNAEHWIGRYGATIPVAANEYSDSIPLPIEPDYEGTFIDHISDNKNIVLKDGLYLVDCLLSFRQNPDSLNNTLGYVHVFTGLDDGESGVFQRNETLPDTDPDELHNIRVQFVRHVEGSTGCNVCFQVRTTNAWSFVRIQSLSIVKLGASGGIAPQPIEYDAGQYISIDGDVISVTGVQPAGNYADASSVSQGFYDVNQQLNALSGRINEVSGQIPSLDGYATESWVNDQGFLKEVPSEFVTESELNSAISGKADKSEIPSLEGYATEEWVRQQNYLTEVPSQYVTESELNSAISGKADKSEIPSLDGYATETYVQSAVSGKQDELEFTYDEENKITTIDGHGIAGTGGGGGSGAVYTPGQYISIQNDIISVTGLQPSGEYLTQDDLNGYATDDDVEAAVSGKADKSEIPSLSGYATEEYVQSEVSGKADKSEIPSLQGYATEEWVGQQGYLTSVPSEYVKQDELSAYITETELESELSGKADVSAIPSVAGLASETYVDQHIEEATSGKADVSAIPSLSGYATENWVSEQGYLTSVPSEYVTETELATELSGKADVSAIPSLSGYATESWVSQQGYLTEVPAGYATVDDVDEATSGKADLSAIANLSAGVGISITASGDGYVISSTGGGGSVPEGVMAESGLKYNAVGEISGYGDSAIAQYGAEKQWLVHDDTIVHMSNSAQYAFGVNLSAVAQLLGIDETVLFDGQVTVNVGNTAQLSESIHNFEYIKVIDNSLNVGGTRRLTIIPVVSGTTSIGTNDTWTDVGWNPTSADSKYAGFNFYMIDSDGTTITMNGSYISHMGNAGAPAARNDGNLYKIIGVHRISD